MFRFCYMFYLSFSFPSPPFCSVWLLILLLFEWRWRRRQIRWLTSRCRLMILERKSFAVWLMFTWRYRSDRICHKLSYSRGLFLYLQHLPRRLWFWYFWFRFLRDCLRERWQQFLCCRLNRTQTKCLLKWLCFLNLRFPFGFGLEYYWMKNVKQFSRKIMKINKMTWV